MRLETKTPTDLAIMMQLWVTSQLDYCDVLYLGLSLKSCFKSAAATKDGSLTNCLLVYIIWSQTMVNQSVNFTSCCSISGLKSAANTYLYSFRWLGRRWSEIPSCPIWISLQVTIIFWGLVLQPTTKTGWVEINVRHGLFSGSTRWWNSSGGVRLSPSCDLKWLQ